MGRILQLIHPMSRCCSTSRRCKIWSLVSIAKCFKLSRDRGISWARICLLSSKSRGTDFNCKSCSRSIVNNKKSWVILYILPSLLLLSQETYPTLIDLLLFLLTNLSNFPTLSLVTKIINKPQKGQLYSKWTKEVVSLGLISSLSTKSLTKVFRIQLLKDFLLSEIVTLVHVS